MINACHQLLTRLRTACPTIHPTRLRALLTAVETAVHHQRLTLTELGRGLQGSALVKHNIKRIDRLLGAHRQSNTHTPECSHPHGTMHR